MVLCDGEQCLHATDSEIEWVVDTGASFHVTPRRDLFSTYVAGDHGSVKMGNASSSVIHGIGDVCIKTALGYTLTLKEVRHVPDLRLNLMSCIMLDRQRYTSTFGSGAWRLSKGSLTVARGKVCCTLYKTISEVCRDGVNMAAAELTLELWHRCLGHLNEKGLEMLAKKNAFTNPGSMAFKACEDCAMGKLHKVTFQLRQQRKTEVLDLVHTDVCGPMDVVSFGGSQYFITFIDNASRKV